MTFERKVSIEWEVDKSDKGGKANEADGIEGEVRMGS